MTHDDVLALLSLIGRSDANLLPVYEHFTDRQMKMIRREGLYGTTWRITHLLNHPTRAARAKAELFLARVMSLEEPWA